MQDTPQEPQPSALQAFTSNLDAAQHNAIVAKFAPTVSNLRDLLDTAAEIKVAGPKDHASMADAAGIGDALKRVLRRVENVRKGLKAPVNQLGKAIDACAKHLAAQITPFERQLREQADYLLRAAEKALAALEEERWHELEELGAEPVVYNLRDMSAESYAKVVEDAKLAQAARATPRIDDPAPVQDAREQQSMRDAMAAPDADKLRKFMDAIQAIESPDVSSETAHSAAYAARMLLTEAAFALRDAIAEIEQSKEAAR